jgi:hypothetical protein
MQCELAGQPSVSMRIDGGTRSRPIFSQKASAISEVAAITGNSKRIV